ncbi:MAG: PEP-CTERM sorting domain-containing protein, partial [Rubrivivax sp.]|nr:PEP-CTERM sorting domain-containing protein [Rubrivivax sp.]
FVPFSAVVDGSSEIVEVVDPSGPVVRVQTAALGVGSFGSLNYFSGDLLNLATGEGRGSNRFVMVDGDELFGNFDVQMLPGLDPSLFTLSGLVTFVGGTGDFLNARGSAAFNGTGQFIAASLALTHFEFVGRVDVADVPEPATLLLVAAALVLMAGLARSGRQPLPVSFDLGAHLNRCGTA